MAASINDKTVINSIEFAQKARSTHDIIPVSRFARLADMLADTTGELCCRVEGGKDADNANYIRLLIKGRLNLTCQRCLQPYGYDVEVDRQFKLARNESELPEPEDERDDEEFLLAEDEMPVLALIEDELILTLPMAPMHLEKDCSIKERVVEVGKPNPFAMLETLKKHK